MSQTNNYLKSLCRLLSWLDIMQWTKKIGWLSQRITQYCHKEKKIEPVLTWLSLISIMTGKTSSMDSLFLFFMRPWWIVPTINFFSKRETQWWFWVLTGKFHDMHSILLLWWSLKDPLWFSCVIILLDFTFEFYQGNQCPGLFSHPTTIPALCSGKKAQKHPVLWYCRLWLLAKPALFTAKKSTMMSISEGHQNGVIHSKLEEMDQGKR